MFDHRLAQRIGSDYPHAFDRAAGRERGVDSRDAASGRMPVGRRHLRHTPLAPIGPSDTRQSRRIRVGVADHSLFVRLYFGKLWHLVPDELGSAHIFMLRQSDVEIGAEWTGDFFANLRP